MELAFSRCIPEKPVELARAYENRSCRCLARPRFISWNFTGRLKQNVNYRQPRRTPANIVSHRHKLKHGQIRAPAPQKPRQIPYTGTPKNRDKLRNTPINMGKSRNTTGLY
ncbi:hypothetical protein NG798_20670 [Ancylothrix sp. C2]|uniref:hypothetical protein n=1 Tax=Ancylothrix sp. D3o TaxID=2953691 RepID=UPI0021BA873D|nr:hypothetical protein [Ancylothrix sp. D3o]MCT7952215.1 hypothetical protein [Ancylothrix sp. D3o]